MGISNSNSGEYVMSQVIYLATRYSAKRKMDFQVQMSITKESAREIVLAGYEVIVPHLCYPTFLDDNCTKERLIGTQSAIKLLNVCDALFVHTGLRVSKGMRAEIETAKQKNMLIYYFRNKNELKDLLKRTKGLL